MLTSHKVSHLKVNNVTGVLKSSKPSFGLHTQQAVAASTAFSSTSSLYYMSHRSQCLSNLVTTPFSCVLLTLQSVIHQNVTCQPSSSYCRIHMILDRLKNELKSPFTANITKGFLLHADKNGKHFCEQNFYNGNENGENICEENFDGDNLNPHNINKLSCTNQSPQETQHLCLPEICPSSVGPEHQLSKIYESLITENIECSHQGCNRHHNDGNFTFLYSLLGVPVQLSNGIAEQKHQSNLHTQGDLLVSKVAVWVPCTGNRA